MNLILKNSLKNIFGKPFRTLLVTFAIFVCSLCAMLCFDLSGTLDKLITNMFGSISRADIMVSSDGRDLSDAIADFPESDILKITANSETVYLDIEGEYNYVSTDSIKIYGLDITQAANMEFMNYVDLGYGEVIITKDVANDLGYAPGDTIIVHDRAGGEVELTVNSILSDNEKNPLLAGGKKAIINMETSDLLSCGIRESALIMIDVKDDSEIDNACDLLRSAFPNATVDKMSLTESDMESINELKAFLYLLFAVTFLLVIFVTASICNRIVSERMSFIGTLRSLGMSSARTGRILLLENVLYAAFGAVPAVLIYGVFREPLLNGLLVVEGDVELQIPPMSIALAAGVLIGAAVIECLIPLRAILKALGTSIRDIIFDNRDTEYRFSRTSLVIGLICLAAAIMTLFLKKTLFIAIITMTTTVVALALLFPYVLRFVSKAVEKLAEKTGNARWALAAVETISRKSTVGSGILCATASAMCVIIMTVALSSSVSWNDVPFDCDVVVSCSDQARYLSFIDHLDGVTETETIYKNIMTFTLNDEKTESTGNLAGLPEGGFKHYNMFSGLPEKIEDGEVYVSSSYVSRKGLNVGDTITLTIDPDGVFPMIRTYKIAGVIESNSFESGMETFVVSEEEYKLVYRDLPEYILVKCSDPERISALIGRYGSMFCTEAQTLSEVIEETREQNAQLTTIMTVIICVALGMTCIGTISNQLIGFEGRKKECAVMLSTAMGKKTLSGILTKEVLLTSFTAAGTGTAAGVLLTNVIASAVRNTENLIMQIETDPVSIFVFFIILVVLFTGTVIFPVRNLKKMKISEQIKYE